MAAPSALPAAPSALFLWPERGSATIASSMQTASAPIISAELRRRLAEAQRVLVLTGAGVSAESGVPTFRGGGDSATWKGLPFDVISSGTMLARNLPAVWEWFDYRRDVLASLQPNPAHQAIARWQDRFPELTVVSSEIGRAHV